MDGMNGWMISAGLLCPTENRCRKESPPDRRCWWWALESSIRENKREGGRGEDRRGEERRGGELRIWRGNRKASSVLSGTVSVQQKTEWQEDRKQRSETKRWERKRASWWKQWVTLPDSNVSWGILRHEHITHPSVSEYLSPAFLSFFSSYLPLTCVSFISSIARSSCLFRSLYLPSQVTAAQCRGVLSFVRVRVIQWGHQHGNLTSEINTYTNIKKSKDPEALNWWISRGFTSF